MTTLWSVPPDLWRGQTVAVLASGPSLTQELADSVRHLPRIAVRRAFQVAPDADMLISLDGPTGSMDDAFWDDARDFAGMKICGTECDVDALYPGMLYECVAIGPAHVIEIRNNGLAAIRIAERAGAAKVLLLGFDTERYETVHGFAGLTAGLAAIESELRAKGIDIERIDAPIKRKRSSS